MKKKSTKNKNERRATFLNLKVAIAVIMILSGIIIMLITNDLQTAVRLIQVVYNIGLSLVVAGVVGLFTEFAFGSYWSSIIESQKSGMVKVADIRHGYGGYHNWLNQKSTKEAQFSGRSVLHNMEKDFDKNFNYSVVDVFIKQMQKGMSIKVLFLDPSWDMINQIAKSEGRSTPKELYHDLDKSTNITKDLADKLCEIKPSGSINIKIVSEINQYAYHYIDYGDENPEMLVGFYFAEQVGLRSSLFRVDDVYVQDRFKSHFGSLYDKATDLLHYANHEVEFNSEYYEHLRIVIKQFS